MLGREKELAEFVDGYLKGLSQKYEVPPPEWRFARLPRRLPAKYYPLLAQVRVNQHANLFFSVDPELTRKALKFYLAHEFYRHVMLKSLRGKPVRMTVMRINLERTQRLVDQFAFGETGVAPHEAKIDWAVLMLKTSFPVPAWFEKGASPAKPGSW